MGRFYETPHGIFPSVTTVLSSVPNPHLDAWRERMGEQEANRVSKRATDRGTRFHAYCESVLKNEIPAKLDIFDRASFKGIDPILARIKPLAIEKFCYSRDLRVAGSMDCFCKLDGKFAVLDFKTSNHEKFDGEFDPYWMQTSAYTNMLYDQYSIKVEDLCIVMQFDGDTRIFWEKASNWENKFREIRNNYKYDEQEILDEIKQHQQTISLRFTN